LTDVRIVDEDGELLSEFTIDPSRSYQPLGKRRTRKDVSGHV